VSVAPSEALARGRMASASSASALARWWPLALITALAAALRLATLGQQSLWFDEAFTPIHVFHASLGATLHAIAQTENTPPLWYVLDWAISRVLGTGAVELRLLSALAGIATVPVAWAIARRLAGSRAALVAAGLVAVNPLFVWYSQEARAYSLFVLTASIATLCFLRALEQPTRSRLLQFALGGSLALLTHYFAVFLLTPMVMWLAAVLLGRVDRVVLAGDGFGASLSAYPSPGDEGGDVSLRAAPPARTRARAWAPFALLAIPVLAGAALIPLVLVQASHSGTTQWIGGWALSSRLQAIPQYYLTGYSGAPLGHAIELLVAVPALAGIGFGLWRGLLGRERRGAVIALALATCGVLIPIALALVGVDYLAPRNLVAAMVPVTVLLAIVIAAQRTGLVGVLGASVLALAFAAVTVDVDRSPRLQRGDWAGLAEVLRKAAPQQAVTTVHLGTAPLQYYLPSLRSLSPRVQAVTVREIDETGYPPLRSSAGRPPPGGFRLMERRDVKGLLVYRFVSRTPVTISAQALRQDAIAAAHTEVLVPAKR
jgi:mannosyltransferase